MNNKASEKPVLLLVDGHAYAYRAFYAIRSLSSPDGSPTNAIYGFVKMLQKILLQSGATCAAVVWDGGLAEGRRTALPDYKANRPEMPGDLAVQLDEITQYLDAAGIASLCQDGLEADDWIARLAQDALVSGHRVIIASADKDFFQLIGPDLGMINPNDKEERLWSAAEVIAKTGVSPHQIVDWLSLLGDAVDNIPGVPGIGPKTAADLLNKFGSLDQIYAGLDKVASERQRKALTDAREAVFRNREMVRLWVEAAPTSDFGALQFKAPKNDKLSELYRKWGFKTLLRELEQTQAAGELLLC
ncbi:MAG TPA: 5'-3' exonuclease H3TH domain-containing protein [Verrucomicrobiae bacterium]